jgi:hypothetical protein
VTVYVDGVEVRVIELGTLIRFSFVGVAAFPKPSTTAATAKQVNGVNGEDKKQEPAVEKASTNGTASYKPTHPRKFEHAVSSDNGTKILNLKDSRFWLTPSAAAINFVLTWMEDAKKTPRNAQPPICLPANFENKSIDEAVDFYAAMLYLDIRPPPLVVAGKLKDRVSSTPPTLEVLRAVHERLPIDDAVMTRTITSFFEHIDKQAYNGMGNEYYDLMAYIKDPQVDPDLCDRFAAVQSSRESKAQMMKRGQRNGWGRRRGSGNSSSTKSGETGHSGVNGVNGGGVQASVEEVVSGVAEMGIAEGSNGVKGGK